MAGAKAGVKGVGGCKNAGEGKGKEGIDAGKDVSMRQEESVWLAWACSYMRI